MPAQLLEPVNVAHLGCVERRLVQNRADTINKLGGGFGISMAGAGAALFTKRDWQSCLGQFVDAYAVRPYNSIMVRTHLDCGKIHLLTQPNGEHEGLYDPDDVGSLYSLADAGCKLVLNELHDAYGVTVHGMTEVVEIRFTAGRYYGVQVERPKYCRPLADEFFDRYGPTLRSKTV
jgi:hypothetical protein